MGKKKEKPPIAEFDLEITKTEIQRANMTFMALVVAGDSIGIANAYTKDAKLMSPGAPAIVGRANIQTAISNIIQSGITGIQINLENIYGTGNLIAEEGELTLFSGNDTVAVEKYIALWKKEGGKWKLFRDIFNTNLPAK